MKLNPGVNGEIIGLLLDKIKENQLENNYDACIEICDILKTALEMERFNHFRFGKIIKPTDKERC